MISIYLPLIGAVVYICLYFIVTQYFAYRKFIYLQETSLAIIVGAATGAFLYAFSNFYDAEESQKWVRTVIFLILLPPIMFEDGYNFPRRKFFQNFLYINVLGLLGTFLNFVTVWGLLYLFNQLNLYISVSDRQEVIKLTNWQILLMSAAFCSIEPVITEKIVDKERYTKLFSVIFGQALYKDTIAITLFDTINQMVVNSSGTIIDIHDTDIGLIVATFLEVVACSILIGLAGGFITTAIFKNCRFLVQEKGITEMALTILTGYLCYVISQWLTFSGVISMLFCGMVLSHYNRYNLTDQGKQTTAITVQVLKIAACGLIFFFIGFEIYNIQSFVSTIDNNDKSSFSPSLLAFTFLALLIGRFANVYLISLICNSLARCTKKKWRLNIYEDFIIYLAGLIHGAVPFALSVTMPDITLPSTNCAQLNIICVVIISTLLFNLFAPKLMKVMQSKIRNLYKTNPDHPSLRDSLGHSKLRMTMVKATFQPGSFADNQLPLHETQQQIAFFKKFKSTTQKYWRKLEEGVIKPLLIYDYYNRRDMIKMHKIEERIKEHENRMLKFMSSDQNILDPDDEENNKFVEVVRDDSDSEPEKGKFKVPKSRKSDQPEKQVKKAETELPFLNRLSTPEPKPHEKRRRTIMEMHHDRQPQGMEDSRGYALTEPFLELKKGQQSIVEVELPPQSPNF